MPRRRGNQSDRKPHNALPTQPAASCEQNILFALPFFFSVTACSKPSNPESRSDSSPMRKHQYEPSDPATSKKTNKNEQRKTLPAKIEYELCEMEYKERKLLERQLMQERAQLATLFCALSAKITGMKNATIEFNNVISLFTTQAFVLLTTQEHADRCKITEEHNETFSELQTMQEDDEVIDSLGKDCVKVDKVDPSSSQRLFQAESLPSAPPAQAAGWFSWPSNTQKNTV